MTGWLERVDELERLLQGPRDHNTRARENLLDGILAENARYLIDATKRNRASMRIVSEQAGDEGLWGTNVDGTTNIVEAYLQKELRRLHEAVEGKTQLESVIEAVGKVRS